MPRLPGPEALGDAPSMRSGRDIARIGNIDTGAGELAKGLNALAAGFETQDREQGAVDAARADARLTTGLLDLDRQFENDTDYETYQQRYAESATRLQQDAAGMIRNPRVRERWMPRAEINVARGLDRVLGYGSRRRSQAHTEDLSGTVSQLTNYYASLGDSPEDDVRRDIARQNIAETLNLARGAGIVPPNALRQMQEQLDYGLPEVDARAYAERNPWAALRDITQGDQRSQQPSSGEISDQGLAFLQRLEPRSETTRLTPTEQAANARRLRSETAATSAWIKDNVTVPLTQLQHDTLVSIGHRLGTDVLNENLPLINTGDFSTLVQGRGNLTAMEQPSERPERAPGPTSEGPRNIAPADPAAFRPLTNLRSSGPRQGNVEGIVFHHTAGSDLASALSTNRQVGTGANYYIDRDGTIHAGDDNAVMAHVQGRDSPGGRNGNHMHLDSANTVGVEIVARNEADVTPEQRAAARALAMHLQGAYGFPAANIIGHGEIQGDGPQPILRRTAARQNDEGAVAAEIRQSLEGQEPGTRVAGSRTRVAQAPTGTMTDASPTGRPTLPGDGQDRGLFSAEESEGLLNRAPSSRFQNLTPERRQAITTHIRNGLKNITRDDVNSDLERIKRTGQPLVGPDGTTSFDRARLVFTDNESARIELARQEAERTHAATAPLNNMSEEQARAHLANLAPSGVEEGESYNVAARVQDRAERDLDRLVEFRQRDSAQAVMGGRIRGSGTGRRLAVNADGTLATLPGDDDLRARPAQEVTNAFDILRRRYPEITINSDDDGNITISGADPARPEAMQNVWRSIIDARLQAQDRLGIDRNPITRAEASTLLGLQRGEAARMDPDALMRRLKQAADRAYATYGETYGALAFDTAIKYSGLTGENAREAAGLVRSIFNGERMTRPEVERFMRLNQMDQETRLWLGTMPNEQRWTGPGARSDYLGGITGITGEGMPFDGPGLSNIGDPRMDRPGIMNQMPSPDAPRSFAGRPLSSQAERQFETPTPDEIEWLRANPDQWRLFDEDFGPGSSATYLQDQAPPRGARSR